MLAGLYGGPGGSWGNLWPPAPRPTALGSLVHYITHARADDFQPANISFDLLLPLERDGAQADPRQAGSDVAYSARRAPGGFF